MTPDDKKLVEKSVRRAKEDPSDPRECCAFPTWKGGKCLIYGDATGDNIILDRDGNIWFIDWSSARKGEPETDIRKFRRWLRREARETAAE